MREGGGGVYRKLGGGHPWGLRLVSAERGGQILFSGGQNNHHNVNLHSVGVPVCMCGIFVLLQQSFSQRRFSCTVVSTPDGMSKDSVHMLVMVRILLAKRRAAGPNQHTQRHILTHAPRAPFCKFPDCSNACCFLFIEYGYRTLQKFKLLCEWSSLFFLAHHLYFQCEMETAA